MAEKKWVKAGAYGPVPTEANSTRYIGEEPVEIVMSSYYARRLMSGELVEVSPPAAPSLKGKE